MQLTIYVWNKLQVNQVFADFIPGGVVIDENNCCNNFPGDEEEEEGAT
jgi:hypothetical protein